MRYFLTFSILLFLASCATLDYEINKRYDFPIETSSVVMTAKLKIRSIDTDIEKIYLLNRLNYQLIPLEADIFNTYYNKNVPIGEYRVAFIQGAYSLNDIHFRIMVHTDYVVKITEAGKKYNIGFLVYNCDVASLKFSNVNYEINPILSKNKDFLSYSFNMPKKIDLAEVNDLIIKEMPIGNAVYQEEDDGTLYNKLKSISQRIKAVNADNRNEIIDVFKNEGLNEAFIIADKMYNEYKLPIYREVIGDIYYMTGDLDSALEIYKELKEYNSGYCKYYEMKGLIAYKNADYEEARTNFYIAVSYNSNNPEVYKLYANLYLNSGDTENAKLMVDYALKLDKNNEEIFLLQKKIIQAE